MERWEPMAKTPLDYEAQRPGDRRPISLGMRRAIIVGIGAAVLLLLCWIFMMVNAIDQTIRAGAKL